MDKLKKISDIDSNFKMRPIGDKKLAFIEPFNDPFVLTGFNWFSKEHKFCRLPQKSLSLFSDGIKQLAWNTSGGMIRFKTNSPTIAIRVELLSADDMSHMPRTGISGFDFYKGSKKDKKFVAVVMPEANKDFYQALVIDDGVNDMREWTLDFPLYNGVKKIEIGLNPDSIIKGPDPFTIEKPIAFYGSSITQGACASRPGNDYAHILARWTDASILNFGFSGSAKGESEMAEIISKIDMSAFILDYDHNADSAEDLVKTHQKFFDVVRNENPNLPVIIISKPDYDSNPTVNEERRKVVYKTYENAVSNGDKNVYFVDGRTLFKEHDRDSCTVDGCHPNDLGFMRMAETVYPILKKALKI